MSPVAAAAADGGSAGGRPAQALSYAHPYPAKGMFVRRPRTTVLVVLALLNVVTIAAGLAVANMLPPRLARLRIPVAAARPVVNATPVLAPAGAAAAKRPRGD